MIRAGRQKEPSGAQFQTAQKASQSAYRFLVNRNKPFEADQDQPEVGIHKLGAL